MDAKAKNAPAGVTHDHASDIDQPEAQLFDPQPPPRAVQMDILEELDQVISQKLELKEDGIGQKVFREDMVEGIPFLELPDDILSFAPLEVEADHLMRRPVGVGEVEAIAVLKLREQSLLVVSFAHRDQPIDRSLFLRTDKMEAFSNFLVGLAAPKSFSVLYPLDYLENSLRLPPLNDKPDCVLVTVAHEPMFITGGVRAQQELNLRKMFDKIAVDFPDQAQVV